MYCTEGDKPAKTVTLMGYLGKSSHYPNDSHYTTTNYNIDASSTTTTTITTTH